MASQYDDLIRETRAKLKQGIKPDHVPAAAAKPSEPYDPFPTQEDLDAHEAASRWIAEHEHGLENDPDKRRIDDAVQAALARREAEEAAALEFVREDQAASRAPLMDLFDAYVAERNPAPATVKRWRPVMDHLKGFLGHDDAARITRKDVVAWKDALLAEKGEDGEPLRKAKTVKETYLASLHVVLKYAADNARVKSNVAADVTVRVPKRVRLRDPQFSKEEAQTILRAALQPQHEALSPEHKLARRWVPWLCAYTGARVNEMTQLRGQDVEQIEGVWTLRITPEAGSVKGGKARVVPIHEHLIAQGFLDVVEAQGKGPLFYNPDRGRGGSEGNPHHKKMGERLAAWVREIGVNDPNVQPNHGWRHLFKAIARRVRMDPHARDAIQGHAPASEGEGYAAPELPVLAEELARFPRFTTDAPA
jgi:integrase